MKDELSRKIITKFVGLRAEPYSYLIDDSGEDKKARYTKKCVIKRKLKFENYKICLKPTRIENKIDYLEKSKIDINSVKEFIKSNKSKLKIRQRFKSESHNISTEEIKKIAFSSNDDKRIRIRSFDLKERYAHGASKDLVGDKEEIKCNNIIKRYEK